MASEKGTVQTQLFSFYWEKIIDLSFGMDLFSGTVKKSVGSKKVGGCEEVLLIFLQKLDRGQIFSGKTWKGLPERVIAPYAKEISPLWELFSSTTRNVLASWESSETIR